MCNNKLFLVISATLFTSQALGLPCWGWDWGNSWNNNWNNNNNNNNNWGWNWGWDWWNQPSNPTPIPTPAPAPKPTPTPVIPVVDCSKPEFKYLPECKPDCSKIGRAHV